MTDALTSFFSAWHEADAPAIEARLETALAHPFRYADPSTPHVIEDLGQLADFIAADAARMPGTYARVASCDTVADCLRARVEFYTDGAPYRSAQYFVIMDDTQKIAQITGFAGMGE